MEKAIVVMLVMGLILGAVLAIASIVFYVKEDERVEGVIARLPGFNCGGCGYPGCSGYAAALVEKNVNTVSMCKPCKPEVRQEIADYLAQTPGPDGETISVTA